MKWIVLLCCVLAFACSKDKTPGFTSPAGKWMYTTPDGKIAVTFEVITTSTAVFDIQNQTLKINDVLAKAEKQVVDFTATSIGKIRINANDAKAIYPYEIIFNTASISSDFELINVPTATYTYPWGTTITLTNITIKRL